MFELFLNKVDHLHLEIITETNEDYQVTQAPGCRGIAVYGPWSKCPPCKKSNDDEYRNRTVTFLNGAYQPECDYSQDICQIEPCVTQSQVKTCNLRIQSHSIHIF